MAGMHSKAFESAEERWWDWMSAERPYSTIPDYASNSTKEEFFNGLVKQCVLLQPLWYTVTTKILVAAINPFATVRAVKLLRSPLYWRIMAVVEMETRASAVRVTHKCMFTVAGMSRPTRAQLAKPIMFMEHPCKPRNPAGVEKQPKPPKGMKIMSPASKLREWKLQRVEECLKEADCLCERQETEEEKLHADTVRKIDISNTAQTDFWGQNLKKMRGNEDEVEKSSMKSKGRKLYEGKKCYATEEEGLHLFFQDNIEGLTESLGRFQDLQEQGSP